MTSGGLVAEGIGFAFAGIAAVGTALNPCPILIPSLSMFSGPAGVGRARN